MFIYAKAALEIDIKNRIAFLYWVYYLLHHIIFQNWLVSLKFYENERKMTNKAKNFLTFLEGNTQSKSFLLLIFCTAPQG